MIVVFDSQSIAFRICVFNINVKILDNRNHRCFSYNTKTTIHNIPMTMPFKYDLNSRFLFISQHNWWSWKKLKQRPTTHLWEVNLNLKKKLHSKIEFRDKKRKKKLNRREITWRTERTLKSVLCDWCDWCVGALLCHSNENDVISWRTFLDSANFPWPIRR